MSVRGPDRGQRASPVRQPRDFDPTTCVPWATAKHLWMEGKVLKGMQRLELVSPRGFRIRLVGHGVGPGGSVNHKEGDAWTSLLLSHDSDVRIQYCHIVPSQGKPELGWLTAGKLLYKFEDLPKDQQFVTTQAIQERLRRQAEPATVIQQVEVVRPPQLSTDERTALLGAYNEAKARAEAHAATADALRSVLDKLGVQL